MRNILQTPAPQVYAWDSRVNGDNPVGAEYIVMERMPGIPLARVWDSLQLQDWIQICLQIFKYQKKWTATKFSQFGSLYYCKDIESALPGTQLYVDEAGHSVDSSRSVVGPAVGREWVDDGRRDLRCDRGPCTSRLSISFLWRLLTIL